MIILGTNSIKDTGYDVSNSLRFNSGSTDFLTTTQTAVTAERKKFTISCWVKRSIIGSGNQTIASAGNGGGSEEFSIFFKSSDALEIYHHNSSSYEMRLITNRLFRDPNAWYHIVFVCDTANGTSALRQRLFVNGTELTNANSDFSTYDESPQNDNLPVNVDERFQIGSASWGNPGGGLGTGYNLFNGYIAEFYQTAGQANVATVFGEYDEDSPTIWKPINPSGLTFGTNGIRLEFKGTGTSANSSGLGADTSGNDNHLTVTNLTAIDQSTDTCTNNFATMNPLDLGATTGGEFLQGNLDVHMGGTAQGVYYSTIGVSTGKWYVEVNPDSGSGGNSYIGISGNANNSRGANDLLGDLAYDYGFYQNDGKVRNNDSDASYGSSYSNGNIIGVYLDLDNNKLYFSINGTVQNSGTGVSISAVTNTPTGNYFFCVGDDNAFAERRFNLNFGSPIESISSSNTDDNGYGNFEYSPNITGDSVAKKFYALNTKNLSEFG